MTDYAFINQDNVVVQVITGIDGATTQLHNGTEIGGSLEAWEQFYQNQSQHSGSICKHTNTTGYRKQLASVGFTYNADADVFIAPQPHPSWTLDSNHDWQPPTPRPTEGNYSWSEAELVWVAI